MPIPTELFWLSVPPSASLTSTTTVATSLSESAPAPLLILTVDQSPLSLFIILKLLVLVHNLRIASAHAQVSSFSLLISILNDIGDICSAAAKQVIDMDIAINIKYILTRIDADADAGTATE